MLNATGRIAAVIVVGLLGGVWAQENGTPEPARAYPLNVCVVTGLKLGAMGAPVDYMHEGRLVRFCCKSCVKQFQAAPAKYLRTLNLIDEALANRKTPAANLPGEAQAVDQGGHPAKGTRQGADHGRVPAGSGDRAVNHGGHSSGYVDHGHAHVGPDVDHGAGHGVGHGGCGSGGCGH